MSAGVVPQTIDLQLTGIQLRRGTADVCPLPAGRAGDVHSLTPAPRR